MPQLTQTLEQRLSAYNISYQRYCFISVILLDAGFTQKQSNKLILKKGPDNAINAVLQHYQSLLSAPYELDHAQIIDIAAHHGGAKNIAVVMEKFNLLKRHFTIAQIVSIAAHDGGSLNINAVIENFDVLKDTFTTAQIVLIAAHVGGARNIKAMIETSAYLQSFGFTTARLVNIVNQDTGADKIYTLQKYFNNLFVGNQHNLEDITAMATYSSSTHTTYKVPKISHDSIDDIELISAATILNKFGLYANNPDSAYVQDENQNDAQLLSKNS